VDRGEHVLGDPPELVGEARRREPPGDAVEWTGLTFASAS